jgi:hypothetical protein
MAYITTQAITALANIHDIFRDSSDKPMPTMAITINFDTFCIAVVLLYRYLVQHIHYKPAVKALEDGAFGLRFVFMYFKPVGVGCYTDELVIWYFYA